MVKLEDLPPKWQKQVKEKLSGKPQPKIMTKPRAQHDPGRMNKLESRFEQEILKPALQNGSISQYKFEPIKLRMAKRTFYSPDFMAVRSNDQAILIYEVKGHWEDDARVKWKTCAELFPEFVFVAVQRLKGCWSYEYYHTEQKPITHGSKN